VEARLSVKVACVFPEPTPYRAPLLDRIADREDVDLVVAYAARSVAGHAWTAPFRHRATFLRGVAIPGMQRVLRHDYPVTPGVGRFLTRESPDVVVVSGWSTFAAQAALLWCRRHHVPHLVVVESHDRDPRPSWRRAVKWSVVPRLLAGASGVLVTGSLARESMRRAGVRAERIWQFANTVDTHAFAERAGHLASRRDELRRGIGVHDEAVVVLSVARLVPDKSLDVLLTATSRVPGAVAVIAGDGPERHRLESLGGLLVGNVERSRIVELYVASDVFALVSRHEPWGVVVNEAAACGLPLVLSEHVGAGADLLEEGGNGFLAPAGDVEAITNALSRLAEDPGLRARFGARSAAIARDWGYESSIAGFVAAVETAVRPR
jgi:glycosyltransferase involved in cell wall biosynthesis